MDDGGRAPEDGKPFPILPSEVVPRDEAETELLHDIWSADAHIAREHARQAAVVAELARRRAAERDAAFGSRGGPGPDARARRPAALTDVSDDFVSELALIRNCSEHEASRLAVESILLTTTLAATWAELFAGRLTLRKARVLLDLLGVVSPEIAAGVQARVLPGAESCPANRLADRARYHLYRLDAAARERRRRQAERQADVRVERTADDLGRLVVEGPLPTVHAARNAIDQYARWLRADGDQRPMGVLRSTAALDLILRPWDTSRPPVTAHLHLHVGATSLRSDAPDDAAPAELDGQLVSAAQCRELLVQLDMLQLGPAPAGGSVLIAVDDAATGATVAVATRAELRRGAGRRRGGRRAGRSGGGAPTRGPADAAVPRDDGRGCPSAGPVDGPGLRLPPPTPGYRPSAAQQRWVTARDRHCRMPGCRRRPGRYDIDHAHPYADGGPTDCRNLCCLCRRHHRIKTFARGWSFRLLPDGQLVVRTPSGVVRTSRPPGWCHDPEPDPPWLNEVAPPDPLRR
jgi:hypothetical protein